jgi:malate dehydrogenase
VDLVTKLGFVGAGKIGANSLFATLSLVDVDEVAIVDIVKELAEGEAMDLSSAAVGFGRRTRITGGRDYAALKGSDIVVVSAGLPRKPGMTRMDLLSKNSGIVRGICEQVKTHAPNCIFLLITNPVDVLLTVAAKTLGFPRNRIVGMSSMHDSVRLTDILVDKLGTKDVRGTILGEHGETMFPSPTLSRLPANAKPDWKGLEEQVRQRAIEIISRKGATYYAPAACTARMIHSILGDLKEEIPSCALLEGEYGLKDVSIGVPVILGRRGVERIVEYPLTADEKAKLTASAENVRKNIKETLAAAPSA